MGRNAPTTLTYQFGSLNPHDTFAGARPWRGRLGPWECVLEDGRLTATSVDSYESEPAAQASLEALLRDWEAAAYLSDQYEIRFRADSVAAGDGEAAPQDYVFRRANEAYPAPDPAFTRSPLVDTLLEKIEEFRAGLTELPVALAGLVTAVESAAAEAGADSVADAYNVDPGVLDTLSEMAERGGPSANEGQPSYRGPEWQWMQEALRLVTLQVGRRTTERPAVRLAMEDFRTRL